MRSGMRVGRSAVRLPETTRAFNAYKWRRLYFKCRSVLGATKNIDRGILKRRK